MKFVRRPDGSVALRQAELAEQEHSCVLFAQVRLRGVLEVVMTAHDSGFLPTGFLQFADKVITLIGRYLGGYYTHHFPRVGRGLWCYGLLAGLPALTRDFAATTASKLLFLLVGGTGIEPVAPAV